jgi:hypothetical protein
VYEVLTPDGASANAQQHQAHVERHVETFYLAALSIV